MKQGVKERRDPKIIVKGDLRSCTVIASNLEPKGNCPSEIRTKVLVNIMSQETKEQHFYMCSVLKALKCCLLCMQNNVLSLVL